MTYQPRYAQFARVRGFTPGNEPPCHEFIRWIQRKWRKWETATGRKGPHSQADHAAFDAWLEREKE